MNSLTPLLPGFQQPSIDRNNALTPSPAVYSWKLEDCEINLVKTSYGLGYEIIRKGTIVLQEEIENPGNKSLDDLIECLKKCCAIRNEKGNAIFLYHYKTWKIQGFEISLVRGGGDLVWNVFNSVTKQRHIFEFKNFTAPTLNCHSKTIALIEKIRENAFLISEDIQLLLNEFEIIGIEDTTDNFWRDVALGRAGYFAVGIALFILFTGGLAYMSFAYAAARYLENQHHRNQIASSIKWIKESSLKNKLVVKIEPTSSPSLFDSRVRVSKFMWAVTLVTYKGSVGNHSEIIIEGINDGFIDKNSTISHAKSIAVGQKFIYLAHFTGAAIESKFVKNVNYETRTEIWMRTSDKIKTFMNTIENVKTSCRIPKFSSLGNDSYFGEGHSCFTWAREYLEIADVILGKSIFGAIFTYPKNFTKNPIEFSKLPVNVQI